MLSVHQEWDPLKVCVVGKNYPPEFYSFMKNSKMRNLFEKIARETEEDYQSLIKILKSFNVEVLRPEVPDVVPQEYIDQNLPIPAPVSSIPRDQMIMIGDTFFLFPYDWVNWKINWRGGDEHRVKNFDVCWEPILDYVASKGNKIVYDPNDRDLGYIRVNGIFRIGKDLFFGSKQKMTDWRVLDAIDIMKNTWLQDYNTHAVTTEGHIDGVFSPLKPGLIFSAFDADTYEETFPNWEVVYFEKSQMNSLKEWKYLKRKNHGKWFIPGIYDDDEIIEYVETWLKDWLGYVEETIFDINVLMIDEKNVVVGSYNETAFKALERYGITPHVAPMRHRFFWDGGAHCVTAELHREGERKSFF